MNNQEALTESEELALVVAQPEQQLLSVSRPPDVILQEAKRAAQALQQVISSKPRKVMFGGKQYVESDDWALIARFYGATSKVRETRFVEFGEVKGFEAMADVILVSTGQVISSGEAMCLSDEKNWSNKPLFQLRSMAQTRACAKALRNVFSWVVVLAGFAPTPAEEMDGIADYKKNRPIESDNIPPPAKGKKIKEGQRKRMFAIGGEAGHDNDDIHAVLKTFGFESAKEVLASRYDEICEKLSRSKAAPEPTATIDKAIQSKRLLLVEMMNHSVFTDEQRKKTFDLAEKCGPNDLNVLIQNAEKKINEHNKELDAENIPF